MVIAVPTQNGEVYGHFGKCPQFTLYTVEDGSVTGKKVLDTSEHGHSLLSGFLEEHGASQVVCGGIGQGARDALGQRGIGICAGASGSADAAVEAFLAGKLQDSAVSCHHHHEGAEHTCHHG